MEFIHEANRAQGKKITKNLHCVRTENTNRLYNK